MRLPSLAAPAATLAVLTAGCFSDKPAPAEPAASANGTVQAAATANTFSPQTITVAQGGTVTWQFSTRTHNVTFVTATGVPQNIPNGANTQVTRTFAAPGTFAYACTLHPGMIGTVTVQAPPPTR